MFRRILHRIQKFTPGLAFISLLIASPVVSHAVEITGAGSSAAHPIYARLAAAYGQTSGVKLAYQPIGSSGGLKQIKARAVDFGASDVSPPARELDQENLLAFPSAISGVVPVVNLPGFKPGDLQLTAALVAGMYARTITQWNDPAIAAVNPGKSLPKLAIVPLARQDGSGTTYNLTDYLSKTVPSWKAAFGTNFSIKWAGDVVQVKGSSGMSEAVRNTAGAIGYIDYSYVPQDKLTYARLQNREGRFVAPAAESFTAALSSSGWKSRGAFEEMLTDQPGTASWPITMGTFVIIPRVARQPEATIRVLKFFSWTFLNGDKVVNSMDFVRLPDAVQARIFAELTKVKDGDGKPLQWSPL
jgi:phosphate transport system substrate-binding protein